MQGTWVLKGFVSALPVLLSLLTVTPDFVGAKSDKVVCYYASWAHYRTGAAKYMVEDIPVELCTHVIYAFAVLDAGTLKITEHDSYLDKDDGLASYRKFVDLRRRNPSAKMLLGLGGWTDSRTDKYSRLVASPKLRADFITHAVQFLKRYGFDGLDLDWEYPAYQSSASDKEGFRLWVKELREAFNPHGMLLTAAVSAGKNVIDQGYDVPAVAADLDQIHVMAYDFHGSWEKQVAHHAPLFPAPGQSQELSADFAINHWIKRGAKASKLVLGVPFYGRSWTLAGSDATPGAPATGAGTPGPLMKDAGTLAYYEICSAHERDGWKKISDPAGPYLTKGNQWVGYDDIDAIIGKAKYAKSKGLGGIMIWDIVMDDFRGTCKAGTNPLLRAIVDTLGKPGTGPSSTQAPTEGTTQPTKPSPTSNRPPVTTPTAPGQVNVSECKSTGFTPDPTSCSNFYRCLGDQVYYFRCPPDLYWNQARRNCDWPFNTSCGRN
ncbi:chitotriosidase-1-like [Macrobrachium nipponense]|uniref:chitotriosidase-1-like n=1 Tax=Macrobrachium nipponense TaxID=159736 RepID=UPI0030C7A806